MTQNPYQQPPRQATGGPPPQPYVPAQRGYPADPYYPAQKRPAWPTVIGIISLCWAGLFGSMTLLSIVTRALGAGRAQHQQFSSGMPDWYWNYQGLSNLFAILLYAVLAVGGILLIKRRRAGRSLHVAFIVMSVLAVISSGFLIVTMMQHMQMPPHAPPGSQRMFKAVMAGSLIIGMLIFTAYPLFLTVWFTRPKVNQHVRTWPK